MHLFTRKGRFAPDQVEDGLVYAAEIAQYVSQKTGLEVVPWATLYGEPVGTVSWSARVESQAAMGAARRPSSSRHPVRRAGGGERAPVRRSGRRHTRPDPGDLGGAAGGSAPRRDHDRRVRRRQARRRHRVGRRHDAVLGQADRSRRAPSAVALRGVRHARLGRAFRVARASRRGRRGNVERTPATSNGSTRPVTSSVRGVQASDWCSASRRTAD